MSAKERSGFRNGEGLPTLDKLFANRALEVAGVASMGDGEAADGVLGFSSLLNQRPDISDGETGIIENSVEIRPLAGSQALVIAAIFKRPGYD